MELQLDWVAILSRWLHMITACMLVGSVFFFHVILPSGTKGLDAQGQETLYLRCRRGLKMTVHISLLLFLVSGIYNTWLNRARYKMHPGIMHGLLGMHVLLGLGAITALMIVLAGREPGRKGAAWTRWVLVMLAVGIAAASTLKSARESVMSSMPQKRVTLQGTSR